MIIYFCLMRKMDRKDKELQTVRSGEVWSWNWIILGKNMCKAGRAIYLCRMDFKMAYPTEPEHFKRFLIIMVVHLRFIASTSLAWFFNNMASVHINSCIASSIRPVFRFIAQWMCFSPLSHIPSMTIKAVSSALSFISMRTNHCTRRYTTYFHKCQCGTLGVKQCWKKLSNPSTKKGENPC
mgnify:CR=1 FL=1